MMSIQGVSIIAFSLACIAAMFFFAVWLIRVEHIDKSISSMKKMIDDLKNKEDK